jgi:hypothetical protein
MPLTALANSQSAPGGQSGGTFSMPKFAQSNERARASRIG